MLLIHRRSKPQHRFACSRGDISSSVPRARARRQRTARRIFGRNVRAICSSALRDPARWSGDHRHVCRACRRVARRSGAAFARRIHLIVGAGIPEIGRAILYENPREVAAYRIVTQSPLRCNQGALIVVYISERPPLFTGVPPRGSSLGGVIAAVSICSPATALFARAANSTPLDLARPPHVSGRNPMQSCIVHRLRLCSALVDGVVDRIKAELGPLQRDRPPLRPSPVGCIAPQTRSSIGQRKKTGKERWTIRLRSMGCDLSPCLGEY